MSPHRCHPRRRIALYADILPMRRLGALRIFRCVTSLDVTQCEFALRDLPDGFARRVVRGSVWGSYRAGSFLGYFDSWGIGPRNQMCRGTPMGKGPGKSNIPYMLEDSRGDMGNCLASPRLYYSYIPPIQMGRTPVGNM